MPRDLIRSATALPPKVAAAPAEWRVPSGPKADISRDGVFDLSKT
jgi:hypothetical protein